MNDVGVRGDTDAIMWIEPDPHTTARPPLTVRPIARTGDPRTVTSDSAVIGPVTRWVGRAASRLAGPTRDDLRTWNCMDVTRRVRRSAADAMATVGGTDTVRWRRGRHHLRLSVGAFRRRTHALGAPDTAEATVTGPRRDRAAFTITVFDVGRAGCVIHLRRNGRSPRGSRRRRRSLAAAHDAADRIVAAVLAVDFRPPDDPIRTGPPPPPDRRPPVDRRSVVHGVDPSPLP